MRALALAIFAAVLVIGCSHDATSEEPAPLFQQTDLFEAETGGYAHYRIPAIAVSNTGTLLAFTEARKSAGGDWGTIDILMRRSRDKGATWDEPRKVANVEGPIEQNPVALAQDLAVEGEITYNNFVPIVDRQQGILHFLFCVEYARVYYMRSTDDGDTFSDPVDVTASFEGFRDAYDWRVVATGPGHGIQLDSGRLLVPVWLSDGTGGHAHRPSVVTTIYSDDHGDTWERGEIVVRHPDLKNPSETVAVELADGSVMLNIRHESSNHRRATTTSADGATNWSALRFDDALVEPVCMGSIVADPSSGDIVFVNPASSEPRDPEKPQGSFVRQNVTAFLSRNGAQTWAASRSLEPGVSGYSDLAADADGNFYCFYERGTPTDRGTHVKYLTLARFNAAWVEGGD